MASVTWEKGHSTRLASLSLEQRFILIPLTPFLDPQNLNLILSPATKFLLGYFPMGPDPKDAAG